MRCQRCHLLLQCWIVLVEVRHVLDRSRDEVTDHLHLRIGIFEGEARRSNYPRVEVVRVSERLPHDLVRNHALESGVFDPARHLALNANLLGVPATALVIQYILICCFGTKHRPLYWLGWPLAVQPTHSADGDGFGPGLLRYDTKSAALVEVESNTAQREG